MVEQTLDAAVKAHKLSAGPSKTVGLMLEGAKDWTPTMYSRLVQDYGMEVEIQYAIKEYECTVIDVIVRRMWLGFLNM
uniref:glycerol-3-phosphate dehydrogenase n=1 Tax=Hucho hucho TaxID=62062 RepID=A0A4W5PM55_9TELE